MHLAARRRVFTAVITAAMLLAQVPAYLLPAHLVGATEVAAAGGFDAAFSGQSSDVYGDPGDAFTLAVFFQNTGTQTWLKGTSTEVSLAVEGGWLSSIERVPQTQSSVSPGSLASFNWNTGIPAAQTPGEYRFRGELVNVSAGTFTDSGYTASVRVAQGTTYIVNSTADAGACPDVCTLRSAITAANSNPGADTIVFDVTAMGGGTPTISVASALPSLSEAVVIDGSVGPGTTPGRPNVRINRATSADVGADGLRVFASGVVIRGLLITGFSAGIRAEGGNGRFVGNWSGLDAAGARVGNGWGILLRSAGNVVGGTTPADRNVVSGNQYGVVTSGSAPDNVIIGNYIGTNVAGTAALPNGTGVLLDSPGTDVGGTTPGAGNVISGNSVNGIDVVMPNGTSATIQGNYIGTNAAGDAALGNSGSGIRVYDFGTSASSTVVTIGGTASGARNVISGNGTDGNSHSGIRLEGTGTTATIQGNLIGTNAAGTAAIPNVGDGVHVKGGSALIGGTTPTARNVISGNGSRGIATGTNGSTIWGNYIGTKADGVGALGNASAGVMFFIPTGTPGASNNVVGGTAAGAGNVIANNGLAGIYAFGGTGNSIRGNSILDNGGLGIDLAPQGVTPNDAGDADTGANNLQNFPVISASSTNGNLVIEWTLNSTASMQYHLDFFSSPVCDSTGTSVAYGEGRTYLGSAQTLTDASGNAAGTFTVSLPSESVFTATATEQSGNTSEFSQCTAVAAAPAQPDLVVTSFTAPAEVQPGDTATYTWTIKNQGTATATAVLSGPSLVWADQAWLSTSPTSIAGAYAAGGRVAQSSLEPGQSYTTTFSATVPNVPPGDYYFILETDSNEQVTESSESNNLSAAVPVRVPARYVVNTQDDVSDGACNTAHCSLREAIIESNASPAKDTIAFNITGTGPYSIKPTSPLPEVTDPVAIDGSTQPGFLGQPLIEIDGTNAGAGANGLKISAGTSNVRGLVITRFTGAGIRLLTNGGSQVIGNRIDGNDQGIQIESSGNTIGGTVAAARNVISRNNLGVAIAAGANGNFVLGNYIGTDGTDAAALGNKRGLQISSDNNTVGGTTAGAGNVISGNGDGGAMALGVDLAPASGNVVQGNFIGTNAAGSAAIPNGTVGINILGSGNLIGGPAPGARNVISGNAGVGVNIRAFGSNVVQGNYIGTNAAGTAAISNGTDGITIYGPSNTIGGSNAAYRNVISGYSQAGIRLNGTAASGNVVEGNYIGTDAVGSRPLQSGAGVVIENASNNFIGGTNAAARNVISAGGRGVHISGGSGNRILGNFIGTNASGTARLDFPDGSHGPQNVGVEIQGSTGNVVGGTSALERNVISGNRHAGVVIWTRESNQVLGNYIGTDVTGTIAIPNGSICPNSPRQQCGGVSIQGSSSNTVEGNVISGNIQSGVTIFSPLASQVAALNVVRNNRIGVDATGSALGNLGYGVEIVDASNNTIGRSPAPGGELSGTGNVIAFNLKGVVVTETGVASAISNMILGNVIHSNTDLGIDLGGDGVTPNDPGDVDASPNRLQNFPVVTRAQREDTGMSISATLVGKPNESYRFDFFTNVACDPSGHGEALQVLGTTLVLSNAEGVASFSGTFPITGLAGAEIVTATATDWGTADTSEFSACFDTADTVAPSWPEGARLTTTTLGPKLIEFTWPAASDDRGVASYKVFRDGVLRGTAAATITRYRAGGLASGTAYTFEVQACDAAGNCTALTPQTISTPIGLNNYTWSMAHPLTPGTPVQEHLFQVGLSAWFKFPVRPDQEVTVDLTVPEDYDLLLFKDIAAADRPVTSLKELQVQSSRILDSALIDSALIDSALIDSALIDSSLIDSSLIDSALIDSSLIDSALIDSSLIDSALIDSALIDSALIDSSLIDSALIDSSLIDSALIDSALIDSSLIDSALIDSASSAAARKSVLTRSANFGTVSEQIRRLTFTATGDYYIRVRGKGGRFTTAAPFTVNVSVRPGACETIAPIAVAPGATLLTGTAGGYKTLVLVDLPRMDGTAEEKQALLAAIQAYLGRPEVGGVLVQVGQDARVDAANEQADGSQGCPFGKNLVAAEIKRIIDSYRFNADGSSRNPIAEIVIVGPDSAVPLWREISPPYGGETGYEPPAIHASPTDSALKRNYYLSQDRYGSTQEIEYVGEGVAYLLPIQEIGVSRVLETASEAAAQFQGYVGLTNGHVPSTTSALVTGYDFLQDFATEVRLELLAGMPAGSSVDSLISDTWTTQQLKDLILQQRYDLLSIGGHFTAYSTIGPDYDPATKLRSTEVLDSAVDMRWAVAASPGCHCGLNVPDSDALTPEPDWAQVAARKGFILICGTGYQYGDTELLEYSERLYREFWRHARTGAPVSTAQALLAAKTAYRQKPITADIHIKALLEVMHVGLPVRVTLAAASGTTPTGGSVTDTAVLTGPGATLGLSTAEVQLSAADLGLSAQPISVPVELAAGGTTSATYLTGADGFLASPLEPVLPLVLEPVASDGTVLRGIGFRGGTYTDTASAPGEVALVSVPGTELGSPMIPLISDVFYPIRFWGVTYPAGPAGSEVTLFITPQQLRSTDPAGSGFVRRAFDSVAFRSFYSTFTGAAATAGAFAIEQVSGTVSGSTVTFSVTVFGDPRVRAQEVWVTYTLGDGQWTSKDLTLASSGPVSGREVWTGTLTLLQGQDPAGLRFMAQVANGLGIVSLATNGGEYFGLGIPPDPAQPAPKPAPTSLVLQSPSGPVSAAFGSGLPVSATLTSAGQPVAGGLVTFDLGGQRIRTTTNSSGVASATLPLGRTPGTYQLYAQFGGADLLEPTQSGSVAVTVLKQPTSLALTPQPAAATGQYSDASAPTIVATLQAAGTALREETIYWVVTGTDALGTPRYYATTDITNADGRAVLQIPSIPLPQGTYTVTAHFVGAIPQAGGTAIELSHALYGPSTATGALTVTAEGATVAYTGDTVVAAGSALNVAATVAELADGAHGDLTRTQVRFELTQSGAFVTSATVPVPATGLVSASFTGLPTGVYTVQVVLVGGGFYAAPPLSMLVAVYDPDGGFVTGGGWIDSPAGACKLNAVCEGATGRATFGFVSKYQKGASTPSGQTEFQFKAGGLNFHSSSYDWLVIAGARAQYKGSGTINGGGDYGFMLTAIDGAVAGGGGTDKFRIKIWDRATGTVVYDNEMGSSDDGDPSTVIKGGSIVIHKG